MSLRSKTPFIEKNVGKVSEYKGYDIYRFKQKTLGWSDFDQAYRKDWVLGVKDCYWFVKSGYGFIKACFFDMQFDSVADVEKCIDAIVNNKRIVLTIGEYNKWVSIPNRKNQWGFNKAMLKRLVRDYKACKDPRRKYGYLERLTDANFHTLCGLLKREDYTEAYAWIEGEQGIGTKIKRFNR